MPGVKGISTKKKAHWFTYQSGLFFAGGAPKPSAAAYALPFTATSAPDGVHLWGQLRFLRNGTPAQVQLQFRPAGAPEFGDFGGPQPVTSSFGFFQANAPSQGPGAWRAVWTGSGTTFTSLPAIVG